MKVTVNYDENLGSATMNGTRIPEFPLQGKEWGALVEDTKFSDWEDFGKSRTATLFSSITNKVGYKNMQIRD